MNVDRKIRQAYARIATADRPEVTVTTLTEEQRAPFRDTAAQVEATFLEIGGPRAQEVLDQMKADLSAAAQG